jgi:hypothetical protein
MKKLLAAVLLFCSSLVTAAPDPTPGNGQWVFLEKDAAYMVLDTRDDLLMFRFSFAYRDVNNNRISISQWYVDCGEGKASLFRHQFVDITTDDVLEDQQHPPNWVTFVKDGFGWKVQELECTKLMARVKNSPTHWKHFAS